MRISLIAVDKLRQPFFVEACDEYLRRLARYHSVAVVEVRAARTSDAPAAEAGTILKHAAGATLWAIDGVGRQQSSARLARRVQDLQNAGASRLALAVGGGGPACVGQDLGGICLVPFGVDVPA